jgi:phosphatidylinositol glycan class O
MSGTLPTFIDAGSNFDSYLIEDDNLIQQFYLNNKSVVVLGDDTWLSLFDSRMIKEHYTYPSFNIKDLDSNDINVDKSLKSLLRNQSSDWNLIVAHYLGLDHCGHTFGPRKPTNILIIINHNV